MIMVCVAGAKERGNRGGGGWVNGLLNGFGDYGLNRFEREIAD
jgi:hypothetical protein